MAVMAQEQRDGLAKTVASLCHRIQALATHRAEERPEKRILIALGGVPGSGKSTISAAVLQELPKYGIEGTVVLPMDGFHYPRTTLAAFEDPETAFRRRGAPFTFDADGFVKLVRSLNQTPVTTIHEHETVFRAPAFDHAEKDPVRDAVCISSRTPVIIVEGNYTLLDQQPWSQIADLVDDKWFVDVPAEIALDRLVKRHLAAGIESAVEAAVTRVRGNDLPNGDLIRKFLIEPDVRVVN